MANHKSQHFVPRCYFRPFSSDGEGKAINLFHIGSGRLVRNASIKGQCAKDNFYGKDKRLEKALQAPEGRYSSIVRKVVSDENLTEADLSFLREFSYLQYTRTDTAIRRAKVALDGMTEMVFERDEDDPRNQPMDPDGLAERSIEIFLDSVSETSDLKVCIVCNETGANFVTSDDPSILSNRFYAQRVKGALGGSGISSAGVMLVMPLTPHHLVISYDGGVYTIPEKSHTKIKIFREDDVLAFNQMQFLKAGQNIYFQSWEERDRIKKDLDAIASSRRENWYELHFAVLDGKSDQGKRYRVVGTKEERQNADEALIHLSSIPLLPSIWCSKIKYRSPPRYVDTKSGAGYKRRTVLR